MMRRYLLDTNTVSDLIHDAHGSVATTILRRGVDRICTSIIVAAGSVPGEAFDGCDEACAVALCREAMGVLWARVADSALPAVPWEISGASRAQIDDAARPVRLDGNWIGTISVADFGSSPIQGPFSGSANP